MSKATLFTFTISSFTYTETAVGSTNVSLDSYSGTATAILIPGNVISGVTTYTVISIKSYCFSHKSINSVQIPASVTSIGIGAFLNCANCTAVTFAGSPMLNLIDSTAFEGCIKLPTINIPANVTSFGTNCFRNCYSLTSLNIPAGILNIPNFFASNIKLPSITIPNYIKSIGEGAFQDCSNCTALTFTATSTVTSIGASAFKGCTKITVITIPTTVASIGISAFQNCTTLSSVTFPHTPTLPTIGVDAFTSRANNYTINFDGSVTNPSVLFNNKGIEIDHLLIRNYEQDAISYNIDTSNNRVTLIGFNFPSYIISLDIPPMITYPYVFIQGIVNPFYPVTNIDASGSTATNLKTIDIPYAVTSIASSNFRSVTALTNVYFYSNQNLTIGVTCFTNCPSTCNIYYDISSNRTFDNLKTIFTAVTNKTKYYAMYSSNSISYILSNTIDYYARISNYNGVISTIITLQFLSNISYNNINYIVREIDNETFYGCNNLTSLTIPYSITKIGEYAFYNSTSLTSLVISQMVNYIGQNAFNGNSLKDLYFLNQNNFEFYQFSISTNCNIYFYDWVGTVKNLLSDDTNYNNLYSDLNNIIYILSKNDNTATIYGYNGYIDQLTSLKIPSTVKYYGFVYNIVSIGASAFNGSTNLRSLIIPGSITSIGNSAFDCTKLQGVGFLHTDLLPTDISLNNAFTNINTNCIAYCYSTISNANVLTVDGFTTIKTMGTPPIVCFKEGTKILTDKGYILIEDLRSGYLVKTLKNGYKPIFMIGKKEINHIACEERIKDQLYKCSNSEYPELFEDLVITGCHSILVDKFIDNQREQIINLLKDIYITDDKFRLPPCIDKRATVYEIPGKYTIYHFALENESDRENYGVYANGLLVETCSKRYITKYSHMEVL